MIRLQCRRVYHVSPVFLRVTIAATAVREFIEHDTVKKTAKDITSITPQGVTYIDAAGQQQFIDFKTCHKNQMAWMERTSGAEYTDERSEFYQQAKYVGRRYALSDPPALEFYTIPRIMFEFPTRDDLSDVLVQIKKAGWRTNDGD
jgi:hypothetical protein